MYTPNQTEPYIELLAPGGSPDAVKAAILAGANAVYCGLPELNARCRADNITLAQLPELVKIAHQHKCRIYLTLNTLILENELEKCAEMIAAVQRIGVDAVIIQDVGLIHLVHRYFPGLEVHASTQMTTHNAGQIAFLARFGIVQVNVCRELALPEITELTADARTHGIRTEVFVHGAYCISFSGQCYMSSAMSGRSGNRGACVQPCRRTYIWRNGSRGYSGTPFNLKDNSAYALVNELGQAGVSSVKIEGRIKGYKYVYATVAAWRQQLDRRYSGNRIKRDDPSLHAVFNRCLSAGYLEGKITKAMFGDSSRDQSLVPVARIRSYTADTGVLRLERDVEIDPQTPVLVYTEGFTFICTGFLTTKRGRQLYQLKITHKLKGKISHGDMLYRQADFEIPVAVRTEIETIHSSAQPLTIRVSGKNGTPLSVEMTNGSVTITVATTIVLTPAKSHSLSKEILEEKLGMLGETGFVLAALDLSGLQEGLFLPVSELNDLRRHGIALLSGRSELQAPTISHVKIDRPKSVATGVKPSLAILINEFDDCRLVRAPDTKLLFELPVTIHNNNASYKRYFSDNPSLIPWFPAILIGRHFSNAVAFLETIRPDYIITDNSGIGWVSANARIPWIAGPLLNCTNSLTFTALRDNVSCCGAFVSHELSREQMVAIPAPARMSRWYTVFAPLLLMNTRQCIVRNCNGCEKKFTDETCLESCSASVYISDGRNSTFSVTKRTGFYTQIYNNRHYFNPEVIQDVASDNAVFLLDLRQIDSKTEIKCSRQEMVTLFESYLAGAVPASRLRKVILQTTSAQYTRGI